MKHYTYHGPQTSFTVGETDYCLLDGEKVELDETNKYVHRLLAIGRLKPVEAEALAQPETVSESTAEGTSEAPTRSNKRNSH
jgi:hypothetical protein